MLGDQIGEVRGQAISTRVLGDIGTGPRMETTDQGIGTLYGVQISTTVTYVGTLRPNGTIAGEGTGIVMTEDGEAATYRGAAVGTFVRPGVTSWRGCLLYETASAKLAKLNGIAVAFEYEIDESGKSEGRFFEWK
jgi:hypothetical protein